MAQQANPFGTGGMHFYGSTMRGPGMSNRNRALLLLEQERNTALATIQRIDERIEQMTGQKQAPESTEKEPLPVYAEEDTEGMSEEDIDAALAQIEDLRTQLTASAKVLRDRKKAL